MSVCLPEHLDHISKISYEFVLVLLAHIFIEQFSFIGRGCAIAVIATYFQHDDSVFNMKCK